MQCTCVRKEYIKEVWAQLPNRERHHYTSKLNCLFKSGILTRHFTFGTWKYSVYKVYFQRLKENETSWGRKGNFPTNLLNKKLWFGSSLKNTYPMVFSEICNSVKNKKIIFSPWPLSSGLFLNMLLEEKKFFRLILIKCKLVSFI